MATPPRPSAASRLAVGIIGLGRAGSALGAALQQAGHRVLAVHAVSDASRRRALDRFPDAEIGDAAMVMASADLVLLTVPDDVLPGLAQGLGQASAIRRGQLIAHASGRYGLAPLEPLTRAGALPLALHPAMTLTGAPEDVRRLAGCPFAVTSPEALRPVAEALVLEMGGEPLWVPDEARLRYHAALSHAANHLVTLITDATDLLEGAGIEHAVRLLGPLTAAALDNALRAGDGALTGPVSRGDSGTVAAHLAALADSPVLPAYVAMARRTADRALASGRLSPEQGARLLAVLGIREPGGV